MNIKQELLKIAHKECKESKIKLYLGKGKSVKYCKKVFVHGYFDFRKKYSKLACATGKPDWELILAHELSHLRQWKENCKIWQLYCDTCCDVIDQAISGKNVDEKELEYNARITLLMEQDCEKRSYELLKSLGYENNKLVEYIQKANAYTLFYFYVAKMKKWYKIGKEPYNLKEVWEKFPKTFDFNIDEIFLKLQNVYDSCVQ